MNKEILYVVDAVSNEKNVSKELIFQAVETALAMATRKRYGMGMDARVVVNRQTGDYETFRRWKVMDDEDPEFESPERQILISYAKNRGLDVEIGEYLEEPIASVEFGRIAAQTAKQVIVAKVREAERDKVVSAYRDKVGQLIMGMVKRTDRKGITLDLGENAEAFIPREEMIPGDILHNGARVRGYLKEIRQDARGPQMIVSRSDVNFLMELMKLEVPEVSQEMIDIMGAARDPGSRAKVAVRANLPNVDPIGACVGMRGSRVQSVTNELAGERVDIVIYEDNPVQFVINAMSPADVVSVVVDEDTHTMDVAVTEEKLAQAIGRGGQNVRLASHLTGWQLNVMTQNEAEAKSQNEASRIANMFVGALDVDLEVAEVLVNEGFSSLEEIAYVPLAEFLEIEGFDEDLVEELRQRARNALLTHAIASEESEDAEPELALSDLASMTPEIEARLREAGVTLTVDLAEMATDELAELAALDEETAARLIVEARAPWFN